MELVELKDRYKEPICLALGYFDSVHLGHKQLLDECIASPFKSAVFTFENNPQSQICGDEKQCYTFLERVNIFEQIGMDVVISSLFDKDFMNLRATQFLDIIKENFNVKQVVVGSDYTCGVGAEFKAQDVKNFFEAFGVKTKILPLIMANETKIASRNIRKMLQEGKVEEVNSLLPYPYFAIGKVEKGRNVGGSLVGYPTANIPYPTSKIELKAGVYRTHILIDGKRYLGLTNVGTHPTFDDYNFNIESFLIDFSGDLYGKQIKIEFLEFLREVKKFDNSTELKKQIDIDFRRVLADKSSIFD